MPKDADDLLRITHALLRPETAAAAAAALRGNRATAALEGLVELLARSPAARPALAAIDALEGRAEPVVVDALAAALDSPHASVRLAAVAALRQRPAAKVSGRLRRLLRRDTSWQVRRAAVGALADVPGPERWHVVDAATDPHWRVRHALIQVLLAWGETDEQRREIDERLTRAEPGARVQGVRAYLQYCWTGRPPEAVPAPAAPSPEQRCPFWDWDPAVLARNLERLGDAGRRRSLDVMPFLLGHGDERVRGPALETLRRWAEPGHLAEVLELLDEPRGEAVEAAAKLLASLDLDRAEALARFVLRLPRPSPAQLAWALDQVGTAFPPEVEEPLLADLLPRAAEQPAAVRAAVARLVSRWPQPDARDRLLRFLDDPDAEVQLEALRALNRAGEAMPGRAVLQRLLGSENSALRAEAVRAAFGRGGERDLLAAVPSDPDAGVRTCLADCLIRGNAGEGDPLLDRLQTDPHPHVRAAALTPARAAELVKEPGRETSWHVLAKAARTMRVPLWELEPEPAWQPPAAPPLAEPLRVCQTEPPHARRLGPAGLAVAPLGISGHYGLPVEGFVRAAEAGVNLLFWEPNYRTLTEFLTRLPGRERSRFHVITGTFEADGRRVERDAERALRTLRLERIAVFLLFWVQSWQRVSPDVSEALERLRAGGKVGAFGLSTHSRPLAVEALETGWDPVMVRHSAAHRGAEECIFPRAAERGTSLITFNNTCYGRLLTAHAGLARPDAADCYRYALAQPGVRACLSAPATLAQLEENLAALRDPDLPPERRRLLRAHGDAVYEEDVIFRKLVRGV